MQEVIETLNRLDDLGSSHERVSVRDIQQTIGTHAFGTTLLTLGLLALSPLGDLPGASAVLGLTILGVSAQMVAGRPRVNFPQRLAKRTITGRRLGQMTRFFTHVAGWLAPLIRRRLTYLVKGAAAKSIALCCAILAATMPPLEVVPFGATVPSAAITGFATALVAQDGLLALLTFLLAVLAAVSALLLFI